ncbi:MAG TPA: sigma-70 family RNA polymerase sigma factor [Burkholderiales bacterium]|nr:sigma-70 family RNA polymerase sigma factor [Burkholderiales bacterium]
MNQTTSTSSAVRGAESVSPEAYRGYLLKFALLQLRDPHLAEDAVQETLLAALTAREGFAGKSSVKTWLTGILKHKIVDLQRRQGRETPVADLLRGEVERETDEFDVLFRQRDDHWDTAPRDWGDPERTLEDKRFWQAFELCAQTMSAAVARVFMMRELQGLSTEDICKELDITPTNCWVMLHRARMAFRLCLEQRWLSPTGEGA